MAGSRGSLREGRRPRHQVDQALQRARWPAVDLLPGGALLVFYIGHHIAKWIVRAAGRALTRAHVETTSLQFISRVIYNKREGGKLFVIQDAAMNDLVRPAMYDSFHRIWPVQPRAPMPEVVEGEIAGCAPADVVGPVCESGDYLAKDRYLPPVERGELLCTFSAGAYGSAMSSNYNARPRAAEVLVGVYRHLRVIEGLSVIVQERASDHGGVLQLEHQVVAGLSAEREQWLVSGHDVGRTRHVDARLVVPGREASLEVAVRIGFDPAVGIDTANCRREFEVAIRHRLARVGIHKSARE